MDIRNFKDFANAPKPHTMEGIFDMQRSLLDRYVGVEKLPEYPIDIQSPQNQIIIKDFIARITEELGEAFESYEKLYVIPYHQLSVDGIPHLYNFNEEMADAIHFLVETCLFTGVTTGMLREYLITRIMDDPDSEVGWVGQDIFDLVAKVRPGTNLTALPKFELPDGMDNPFIQGGRSQARPFKAHMAVLMWDVTYQLQLARNTLKNKPWKQTHVLSDEVAFRTHIMEAILNLIYLCSEVGIDENSFYNVYRAKNQVNNFRIDSKY